MNHQISTETLALIEQTLELAEKVVKKEYGNDLQKQDDLVQLGGFFQKTRDAIAADKYRGVIISIDLGELLDFIEMTGLNYEFARSVNDPREFHLDISGFQNRGDVFIFDGLIVQGE